MASPRRLLRGNWQVRSPLEKKATDRATIQRLKEAVECLKRALLGADPREITIHSKLARLHEELDESTEAAAYHRRIVEICRIEGSFLSPKCLPPRSSQSCRATCPRLCQVKYICRSPQYGDSRRGSTTCQGLPRACCE